MCKHTCLIGEKDREPHSFDLIHRKPLVKAIQSVHCAGKVYYRSLVVALRGYSPYESLTFIHYFHGRIGDFHRQACEDRIAGTDQYRVKLCIFFVTVAVLLFWLIQILPQYNCPLTCSESCRSELQPWSPVESFAGILALHYMAPYELLGSSVALSAIDEEKWCSWHGLYCSMLSTESSVNWFGQVIPLQW